MHWPTVLLLSILYDPNRLGEKREPLVVQSCRWKLYNQQLGSNQKTWCIFQPHTYTRTKALLPEFAEALTLADHVVLANIYAARETDTLGISSADLQKRIQELGTPCEYFPTFDEIENYLLENCQPGDLLITMGAGDVYQIGEKLLGK